MWCWLRRLRASSRDGGGVVNRPPSPLNMLLSKHTRRREFITLLGGAVAWPLVARAQQPAGLRTIGFSGQSTRSAESELVAAFTQRLHELGWMENRNITIEYRWAGGRPERF